MSHSSYDIQWTPIHCLVSDRSSQWWELYWNSCEPSAIRTIPFLDLVQGYSHQIKSQNAKRVILVNDDRQLFLAGFLAALCAGAPVVLPHSKALGVIEELCTSSDIIINGELPSIQDNPLNEPLKIDPNKGKIIFYTSGSTGEPKSIEKTLFQLETELACLEGLWGIGEGSCRFLSTVPHHHIYGLLFTLLWPVCAGHPINLNTIHFWEDLLAIYKPDDVLVTSPSHLNRLSSLESASCAFRHIFSSGAPLSFVAANQAKQYLGILPIEILGSTETGGIAYRQQDCDGKPWAPFPGIHIHQDKNNCLGLTSPYLPNDKEYQTQDRIVLQEDQTFSHLGRMDRIVKVEGKRVSLDEIEKYLLNMNEVKEVRVIPLFNSASDLSCKDELGAVIVLSASGVNLLNSKGKAHVGIQLHHHLKKTCEGVTIPRKWRFVTEIPVTSQGKMNQHILQELFKSYKTRTS